jgi:hypothetical protein
MADSADLGRLLGLVGGGERDEPTSPLGVSRLVDEYVFEALRAGASGFLGKGSRPDVLIDAIRTVARGDALLSPPPPGR